MVADTAGSGAAPLFPLLAVPDTDRRGGADIAVDDEAVVTIPHPVLMGESVDAWSRVFEEFDIAQPFEQLHRRVFDGEATSSFAGWRAQDVHPGNVSLKARGWDREQPQTRGAQIASRSVSRRTPRRGPHGVPRIQRRQSPGMGRTEDRARLRLWPAGERVARSHRRFGMLRDLSTIDTHPIVGDEPDLVCEP
ncbi:DUF4132 domain-containing protein [Rhodococcus hoagii]|nr:DUF4132 domain-containing protein [Prescottella equi]